MGDAISRITRSHYALYFINYNKRTSVFFLRSFMFNIRIKWLRKRQAWKCPRKRKAWKSPRKRNELSKREQAGLDRSKEEFRQKPTMLVMARERERQIQKMVQEINRHYAVDIRNQDNLARCELKDCAICNSA